jgi:phage tail-like protein
MASVRPFVLIRTQDQWSRAAHWQTAIDAATGGVELGWSRPVPAGGGAVQMAGGLAFDGECRLYRSVPGEGRVERLLWSAVDPLSFRQEVENASDLFTAEGPDALGDFAPPAGSGMPLREPRGLAVDVDDRLFVAESGARRILVYDIWSRRLLRRVATADGHNPNRHPIDLAGFGRQVWALTADPAGLLRMEARSGPVTVPLNPVAGAPAGSAPIRIAASPAGAVFLLSRAPDGQGWVSALDTVAPVLDVGPAGDLEFTANGDLVVAAGPGDPFRRFERSAEGWTEATPLEGSGYDGMGLVRMPDGSIGFWTSRGLRVAFLGRVLYSRVGRVTTYRLDSGAFQTRWGRMFLDACIPDGTDVRAHWLSTDEPSDDPTIARTPPGNVDITLRRPDLSPPMPPQSLAPTTEDEIRFPVHHRETGRELPWSRPDPTDPFETYEAPVQADPGRYLWVTLELRGNTRTSPRVKCLRVEHPGHDLLRRLPKTYSRDAEMVSFITRYLSMFDGTLTELDGRAADRDVLINPNAAPEEVMPWLASFVGLVLDLRWPAQARRTLIREAIQLFRFRGTVPAMKRFLEIYLGFSVVIIERFRLIGLGGALLSNEGAPATSRAIVGAGFRVGGALGELQTATLTGTLEAAFRLDAHRFALVIPANLSDEQLDVVRHILDVHRPAHTAFDICTVGAGMRVGHGLHLGLSSVIGRTGAFTTLQVGATRLGRDAVVGRPDAGTVLGSSRLGGDSRVG